MADREFKPFIPEQTNLREFTWKAVLLGVIQVAVFSYANVYLGLKAGMTVAATFPAAVIAMALLRPFKGTILEENITRTTAAVGEALAAGAIFTLPAFFMAGVWDHLHYLECTILMFVGGVLGVLFVILFRRPLVEEAGLPFPESIACAELIKAGQKGQSGASYVLGSAVLAGLIQFLKHPSGIPLFGESASGFWEFAKAKVSVLSASHTSSNGMFYQTPAASPALLGVGYIIGVRSSALVFSGGLFGWMLLVPLALYFNGDLIDQAAAAGETIDWMVIGRQLWKEQVRQIAVGGMLVGAVYTLFKLRHTLGSGLSKALADLKRTAGKAGISTSRLQQDISIKKALLSIAIMLIPMFLIYRFFTQSVGAAALTTITMLIAAFFLSAMAAYLVGMIGSSNNPVSGLTLTALVISSLLMVVLGMSGVAGVGAVLGVAAVVCCACCVSGDMAQELKVGQILGGTPWKMQLAEIIGVLVASVTLVFALNVLHTGTEGGIGGPNLSAPQATLMATIAQGIVGGQMNWLLLAVGAFFGIALIMVGAPSIMIVAVGMYLPFDTTFAIFIGGVIKFLLEKFAARSGITKDKFEPVENTGTLLASGLVAGEALLGILLVAMSRISVYDQFTKSIAESLPFRENPWLGFFVVIPVIAAVLIYFPVRAYKKSHA